MELTQSLRQTTRLAMTQHMQQSLQLLQMSTAELCLYLEGKAQENPYLRVQLPSPVERDLAPRPDFVPGWEGSACLEARGPGLYAYLSELIDIRITDPRRKQIAYAFLEVLEPSGWLSHPPEAVALAASAPLRVVEDVLQDLRRFEPIGLFASSLADCLLLQAEAEGTLTWELEALIANLPLLADGKISDLAARCDCAPEDIPVIVAQLRSFDPKPGLQFANDLPPVFPPDLIVRRGSDGWEVELTKSSLPILTVSTDALSKADPDAKAAWNEAQAIATALQKREVTLLKVGAALVQHQQVFLAHGPGHLRPLTLEIVANALELHPSTVSRVCAGRMIQGPRGAFPLKALFSRPVDPLLGTSGPSQDQVMAFLKNELEREDSARPLSDSVLVDKLAEQGIRVARRTVAQYRETLGVPSSYQRRKSA